MDQKPYRTLSAWCREHYGEKLYKLALNAGLTCPSRDGTLDTRGCIFCSAGGSGDFAASPSLSIHDQLLAGRRLLSGKKTGNRFIAYFQAFTNTYGPPSYLERIYREALREPDVAGISIATRPDCLPPEVLSVLLKLKHEFPDKFIWVELGLQTIHERTARYIRRGYDLACFEQAVKALAALGIPVIVHVILGLPGEGREEVLETIRFLNSRPVWGVKLQLLHVLEGTDLAADFRAGLFQTLSMEAYLELLCACIAALRPDMVIHRVTGDGPGKLLIAPDWSRNKRRVLNAFHSALKKDGITQGCAWMGEGPQLCLFTGQPADSPDF